MHGDAAADAHADGRQLSLFGPEAGVCGVVGCADAERGEIGRDRACERAHKVGGADAEGAGIDDGVEHELARAVVGDLAAAVAHDQFDAARTELLLGEEEVCGRSTAPHRDDGVVLEREEPVLAGAIHQRLPGRGLALNRSPVPDASPVGPCEQAGRRCGRRGLHAARRGGRGGAPRRGAAARWCGV